MKYLQTCYNHPAKIRFLWIASIAFAALALLLGILFGSVSLSPAKLFSPPYRSILLYIRLPRALASLVAGAALAVSGAVIQGVLSNPLASPGIIGVNSGAGLAVTLCTAFGLLGGWPLALCSFLGAFGAVMLVSLGAAKWGASRGTVILAGVGLNSLLNALSSAIVTFRPEIGVMSNDFKIGDFSAVTYGKLIPAGTAIVIALVLLLTLSNELDILGMGEETALGLGVNVKRTRTLMLLLAALLAGAAVSLAGLLSFVGLIVPHCVRRLGGSASKHLIPLCALFGGGFVTLCDTVARSAFSPYEIPVGIILSVIGAPFFLWLLIRKKGGHRHA